MLALLNRKSKWLSLHRPQQRNKQRRLRLPELLPSRMLKRCWLLRRLQRQKLPDLNLCDRQLLQLRKNS